MSQRHADNDTSPVPYLHERRVVALSHQVRERDRFQPLPDPPVGVPNTAKAIRIPRPMFSTVSQIRPMPRLAATPPKPMIADVEMQVAPYRIGR